MAIDRDKHVGVVSEPRIVDVEKGFLKFFAKATGESDPVYFDEDAARPRGIRRSRAADLSVLAGAVGAPRSAAYLRQGGGLGIDMARVLHGEQSFTYHARSMLATR
jgi:hypothetical protein